MHYSIIDFFLKNVEVAEIKDRTILEVGSRDVNGSVKPFIECLHPKKYIGVDIEPGKNVDILCDVNDIEERFGAESFDVVITTELLEHVMNWREAIGNLKNVVKQGGYVFLSTRSLGFPFHELPFDCWRYEIEDVTDIFSDFHITALTKDPQCDGLFLKARKPLEYQWRNPLDKIALYSMILGRRTFSIPQMHEMPTMRRCKLAMLTKPRIRKLLKKAYSSVYS